MAIGWPMDNHGKILGQCRSMLASEIGRREGLEGNEYVTAWMTEVADGLMDFSLMHEKAQRIFRDLSSFPR